MLLANGSAATPPYSAEGPTLAFVCANQPAKNWNRRPNCDPLVVKAEISNSWTARLANVRFR